MNAQVKYNNTMEDEKIVPDEYERLFHKYNIEIDPNNIKDSFYRLYRKVSCYSKDQKVTSRAFSIMTMLQLEI